MQVSNKLLAFIKQNLLLDEATYSVLHSQVPLIQKDSFILQSSVDLHESPITETLNFIDKFC